MKKKLLFILTTISTLSLMSQNAPSFPMVDDAYNLVLNQYLKNTQSQFAKDYNITDLTKVKVLKKWESDGNKIESIFTGFSSEFMYKMFPFKNPKPIDRCHIIFLLETPKDKEGVYYQVPIDIVYSRLKNDNLTNNWEFYWNKLGYPTEFGAKEFSKDQKKKCFIEALQHIKLADGKPTLTLSNSTEVDLSILENFYTISKINITYDFRKSVNEFDLIFEIEGEGYYNLDDAKKIEDIKTVSRIVEVDAKITKSTDWEISSIYIRDKYAGNEKPKADEPFWGKLNDVGFYGIFLTKTPYNPSYYAKFNKLNLEKDLKSALLKVFEDPTKNEHLLNQFFDDNSVTAREEKKYLIDLFKNIKSKCVEIYTNDSNIPDINFSERIEANFSEDKFGIVKVNIRFYRKNYLNDESKELKKKYKEAGMSSELLKNGGEFDKNLILEFSCNVVDNYLYLKQINRSKADEFSIDF